MSDSGTVRAAITALSGAFVLVAVSLLVLGHPFVGDQPHRPQTALSARMCKTGIVQKQVMPWELKSADCSADNYGARRLPAESKTSLAKLSLAGIFVLSHY